MRSRAARPRASGENLFVVLLVMAPPSQQLEPPINPGRFTSATIVSDNMVLIGMPWSSEKGMTSVLSRCAAVGDILLV